MRLTDRLKRLEATAPVPAPDRVIKFVPEPEGENSPEVRRKWDAYLATGWCDGPMITVPEDYEVVVNHGFPNIVIRYVEDFYSNNAHELERERQAAAGDNGQ